MSRTPIPRHLLCRQLLHPSRSRPQGCIAPAIARRCYATNPDEGKEDFKGQLYQSTNERVDRERAEQARFAQIREAQKAARGSPGWMVPFVLAVGIAGGWYLGSGRSGYQDTASTLPLSQTEPPQHNTSPANLQAAWTDFRAIVGEENISTQEDNLKQHSGSEWSSYPTLPGDKPFA
ncbi:hypothetical protein KC352_g13272, partial [Hortaea werneckii]